MFFVFQAVQGSILRRRRALVGLVGLIVFALALGAAGAGFAFGGGADVLRLRFGGDAERTRIVVDLAGQARGQVVESGAGGQVVLTLSGVSPRGAMDGEGRGLVRRWRVSDAGSASRLELDLAGAAEIERRFLLPPGDGVNHYRYVIDVKALGAPNAAAATPITPVRAVRESRPAPRRERPVIVIDAGHGGRDPGALGAQVQEKAITLDAARDLKAALERMGRYRVILTRDGDRYVEHGRRVQIARDADADLFISLHADAGGSPDTRGASVYTLSEQGATRALREVTSRSDWTSEMRLPGQDPSVNRILLDMTQRATQNRSAQFARILLSHIGGSDHPLVSRSHRDAGFAVLLAPDVPAVLLEMGFITNADDERALTDDRRRRRLMRAVAEGIDRYFREPEAAMMAATGGAAGAP